MNLRSLNVKEILKSLNFCSKQLPFDGEYAGGHYALIEYHNCVLAFGESTKFNLVKVSTFQSDDCRLAVEGNRLLERIGSPLLIGDLVSDETFKKLNVQPTPGRAAIFIEGDYVVEFNWGEDGRIERVSIEDSVLIRKNQSRQRIKFDEITECNDLDIRKAICGRVFRTNRHPEFLVFSTREIFEFTIIQGAENHGVLRLLYKILTCRIIKNGYEARICWLDPYDQLGKYRYRVFDDRIQIVEPFGVFNQPSLSAEESQALIGRLTEGQKNVMSNALSCFTNNPV